MTTITKTSGIRPKLSVIVPIYGVEKYIERCARSLFEQTLDEIEYIFVNDCSPDRSVEILNNVLNQYPNRISATRIVNMSTNSGLAAVRRHGIQLATGEYIIHCDSDDWIDVNAYKECYELAKQKDYDIVFFDFDRTDGITHQIYQQNIPTKKADLIGALISGKVMGNVWASISKLELYDKIEVYPQYNMHEDLVLALQLVNNADSYGYISKPFYKYFVSETSITSVKSKEKALSVFQQAYTNINLIFDYLQHHNLQGSYTNEIEARKVYVLYTLFSYSEDKNVWILINKTYDIHIRKMLLNDVLPLIFRVGYLLAILRLYPIFKKVLNR